MFGSLAVRFMTSSNAASQYWVLGIFSLYFWAKTDSRWSCRMASENWVIGCVSFGTAFIVSMRYCGRTLRFCHSLETSATSAAVGISPTRRR